MERHVVVLKQLIEQQASELNSLREFAKKVEEKLEASRKAQEEAQSFQKEILVIMENRSVGLSRKLNELMQAIQYHPVVDTIAPAASIDEAQTRKDFLAGRANARQLAAFYSKYRLTANVQPLGGPIRDITVVSTVLTKLGLHTKLAILKDVRVVVIDEMPYASVYQSVASTNSPLVYQPLVPEGVALVLRTVQAAMTNDAEVGTVLEQLSQHLANVQLKEYVKISTRIKLGEVDFEPAANMFYNLVFAEMRKLVPWKYGQDQDLYLSYAMSVSFSKEWRIAGTKALLELLSRYGLKLRSMNDAATIFHIHGLPDHILTFGLEQNEAVVTLRVDGNSRVTYPTSFVSYGLDDKNDAARILLDISDAMNKN